MKSYWIKLSTRLDAMSLRERAMVFCAIVATILFVVYSVVVEPLLLRQTVLLEKINQQQNQIAGIDREIAQMAAGFVLDPDGPARAQLRSVRQQIEAGTDGLLTMQKGLVAPEKIAPLLEQLLRGNGKLKLMALKSLPASGLGGGALQGAGGVQAPGNTPALSDVPPPDSKAAPLASPPKPRELLYRHGVEIVLQGSYLDMINYMDALQALPSQLFWGKAKLEAGQYPNSRLTLTLYTLSLDAKWMKL